MAQQDLRFSDEKYTERLLGAISHHDGYIIHAVVELQPQVLVGCLRTTMMIYIYNHIIPKKDAM